MFRWRFDPFRVLGLGVCLAILAAVGYSTERARIWDAAFAKVGHAAGSPAPRPGDPLLFIGPDPPLETLTQPNALPVPLSLTTEKSHEETKSVRLHAD